MMMITIASHITTRVAESTYDSYLELMYNRAAHILYTNVDEIFQTRELHDL